MVPKPKLEWVPCRYSARLDWQTYKTIHQPMLKVRLSVGTFTMPTEMLVDSGAQDTLLHADLAPVLGIDLSTCPTIPVGGITGRREGYIHTVDFFY